MFSFSPVMIGGWGWKKQVGVTGSLEIRNAGNGEELVFHTERRAMPLGVGGLRDRPADVRGTGTQTMPLPGPDEVLSFEMPPIRVNGGTPVPDQFSIRVQIRPR